MKTKTHRLDLGRVFFPDKEFTTDKPILLKYHPEHPREGATVGYVKKKVKEFYNDSSLNGVVIDDINMVNLEGPDIIHNKSGLFINNQISGDRESTIFEICENGLVGSTRPLKSSDLDPKSNFKWHMLTDTPDKIEGLLEIDLVSSERLDTVTSNTEILNENYIGTSPIPIKYLDTLWLDCSYRLNIGDVVLKFGNPDPDKWLMARGSVVKRSDYPEFFERYVDIKTASNTHDTWEVLNCSVRDRQLNERFDFKVNSYIRMR